MPCYLKNPLAKKLIERVLKKYKIDLDGNFLKFLDEKLEERYSTQEKKASHQIAEKEFSKEVVAKERDIFNWLDGLTLIYRSSHGDEKYSQEIRDKVKEEKRWEEEREARERRGTTEEAMVIYG